MAEQTEGGLRVRACRGHFHACWYDADGTERDDISLPGDPFTAREACQAAIDADARSGNDSAGSPSSDGPREPTAAEIRAALKVLGVVEVHEDFDRASEEVQTLRALCNARLAAASPRDPACALCGLIKSEHRLGYAASRCRFVPPVASPSEATAPSDAAPVFLAISSDRVYCVGCKAWQPTEGFCEGDPDICPIGEEDQGRSPSLAEAQHAIDLLAAELSTLDDESSSHIGAMQEEVRSLRAELTDARKEIAVDDQLIADRDRVLDALPCPTHGRCVPHALKEISSLRAERERDRETPAITPRDLDVLRDASALAGDTNLGADLRGLRDKLALAGHPSPETTPQ